MLLLSSELTAEQARILAHLDSVLVVPEGMETTEDGEKEIYRGAYSLAFERDRHCCVGWLKIAGVTLASVYALSIV